MSGISSNNSSQSGQPQMDKLISVVPEKAQMRYQLHKTVPAQYWGLPAASASAPDGAMTSTVSDPAPLPLLAGSGLSRPHLVLATQAITLPGRPFLPGLPSVCQNQGGLVLDRVLAYGGGDSWWAVLTGRARLGRMVAQRGDLLAAAADVASYGLCASSRVELSRNTVLRSRLDWSPAGGGQGGGQADSASSDPAASGDSAGAVAPSTPGTKRRSGGSAGWASAPPLSLTCQLQSRVGPRTEVRGDLAVRHRTLTSAVNGGGGAASGGWAAVPPSGSGSGPGVVAVTTPLLAGLQAGSAASSGSPLVWRCGVLQVMAPETVQQAGPYDDDTRVASGRGAPLRSAVYVQGTAALQGEHFLWRAPKERPKRRSARAGEAAAASASASTPLAVPAKGSAAAAASDGHPVAAPPSLAPVRQAASHMMHRATGGDDGDDDEEYGDSGGSSAAASSSGAARSRGSSSSPPFGVELPSAGVVQVTLMDATQSIGRLRDDVTQATRWVGEGGLVEQLAAADRAGTGARAAKRPVEKERPGPRPAWSVFVSEPHVKVAGMAGLTARAPLILLTHGSPAAPTADADAASVDSGTSSVAAAGGTSRAGQKGTAVSLLPLRLTWLQDLGLKRPLRRLLRGNRGNGDGGEAASAAATTSQPQARSSADSAEVSRGSVRPFASAAASVQSGRFSGWLLDFTRLTCQLDCGLWGPANRGETADGALATASPASLSGAQPPRRRRHPAFALGDTGAWHALSVSLSQQLIGPLRLAADWRYQLTSSRPLALPQPPQAAEPVDTAGAPRSGAATAAALAAAAGSAASSWLPGAAAGVWGHVGGMRPQLMEAVYALDLAVPGGRGAARVVAWYSPQRREGMVELRLF